MKITMMEELESAKAHRHKWCCVNCGSPFYTIHHSYLPNDKEHGDWWVSCDDCGYEGYESPSRDIALARWRQRHENE